MMEFKPEVFSSGKISDIRWISNNGIEPYYTISKYNYCHKRQVYLEPFYIAYEYPGGNHIDDGIYHKSLDDAINACIKHNAQ